MKNITRFIIFLFIIFGIINISKANYIDTLWGTPYNFYQNYTYTWSVISQIEYFTWNLFVKSISCSNTNDFTNYNNYHIFNINTWDTVKTSLWVFSDVKNRVHFLKFNWYWIKTELVNKFYSWSLLIKYTINTNSLSLNPAYTWSYTTNTCYINWVLFPDWIPNTLNNLSSNSGSSMTWITVYTNSTTLNLFWSNENLLEFYIFEAAIIFLIIIVALLFRLFRF